MKKFGIIGLGFISERHINTIKKLGGKLVVGCDIDKEKKYKLPPGTEFVENWKQLSNYILDYVSICTPNYLHYEMCNYFDERGIKIICEKPLCLDYIGCDVLSDNVNIIQQLRYDDDIIKLSKKIQKDKCYYRVNMDISVHRGDWYWESWKGDKDKSGGILFNIGVHYFDILRLFFGKPVSYKDTFINPMAGHGYINFENAQVKWNMSLNAPIDNQKRLFNINGKLINLNKSIDHLHVKAYEEILASRGFKPKDVKNTLEFINEIYETNTTRF